LENLTIKVIGICNPSPVIDFYGWAINPFICFGYGRQCAMTRDGLGKGKVLVGFLELPRWILNGFVCHGFILS